MKQKINYLYLAGGLIILVIGTYGLFAKENIATLSSLGLPLIGIIYLLYAFHLRPENNAIIFSFFLILISSGYGTFFNSGKLYEGVLFTFFSFFPFVLGLTSLVIGLVVGLFQKPENIGS